ncbi:MAG: hypothetical protein Q8M50_12170 [Hydrogenophaga sp.]|uniref:hypothetical protein n=1 Tax=Hydrogenophaga sp. TaxID=1904254 RepID=UPI00272F4DDA|nr:hypothetical protein [Hydrogenophaga sp.]MDP2406999.1 hypothetical protein [Hydrogenophaga sp.]
MIEKMLEEEPLFLFSLYTDMQARILVDTGHKILQCLDDGLVLPNGVKRPAREAYGLFWLWVLGAYEVTRTMSQHRACFAEPIASDIQAMKKNLHRIRIPFAKQELPGDKKQHVYGELAISYYDFEAKDEGFLIGDEVIWMRRTVIQFEDFISCIKRHHIVGALPKGDASRRFP